MTKNTPKDSLCEKLEHIEMELRCARKQIDKENKTIEEMRKKRAEIYEQEAANDADISQKFDSYKTPELSTQNHYDNAKSAIKAVYYTIRESPDGLGINELKDILATRTNKEIRDAVWFLNDGGDIQGPTRDWKWYVEK